MQTEVHQVPGQLSYTHRSFSQVKQLRTCGYQFKLERIDRVPQRPGAANVAGDAVHKATEQADIQIHAGTIDRDELVTTCTALALGVLEDGLAKNAEEGWEEADHKAFGFKPKQDVAWYRKTGIPNSISAYVDWRISTPDFVLADVPGFGPAIEVPFSYYVGDQQIIGAIDRVFTSRQRGGYFPVDLKSGRLPETNEQLALYGAVLRNVLGWPVEYGYYLYGLKNGRTDWFAKPERGEARLTPPIRVDHWTDDQLASVYLGATRLIELGIYIPHPGSACELCSVSEHCPFAQAVV